MFTPQRKGWHSTRSGVGGSNARNLSKGKGVVFVDEPPPPLGSLSENEEKGLVAFDESGGGGMEDWRRFREAGMLDADMMDRKDRQAIVEKIAKIENELYDYQYNMGILLIEKNEWASKYEELTRTLEETQELLKREKSSHHMVLSEAERREENLRKALGVERQCVADLEKALRGIQVEHAHGKLEAESKFSNANSLVTHTEEKAVEVVRKMTIADAKLAEANRLATELQRRLQEVEARENVIQTERLTLKAEREANEATFRKQKEDLLVWEKKLHEGDVKLCDSRRALRDKEEHLNEVDRLNQLKEKDLNEKLEKFNCLYADLKPKDEDIKSRLSELIIKEEKVDFMKRNLLEKENELVEWEQKLHARESVELQSLLDEHRAKFDAELHGLQLEMQQKRMECDQEFKRKSDDLEKKETEIKHLEAKLAKKEEALEKKSQRLKDKENDVEEKKTILKEKEKFFTSEEKKLANERKQLEIEKEKLENVKDKIEKLRSDVAQKKSQLEEELEKLKVTEQERLEHNHLQSELKQEIEKCRQNVESLLREREELRQEREKFENEWEVLDDKKAEISEYLRRLEEEKKKLEMLRDSEEERLRSEKVAIHDHLQRELDSVKQERELLNANMEMEKALLSEKAEKDREESLQDLVRRMQDFESEVHRRNDEMELEMTKKERAFQEMQEKELNYIKNLKETVEWESEELKSERSRIQKEKQELVLNKQQLEISQFEMRKDIEELSILIKKLRDQREHFTNERTRFLTLVEKLRSCSNCGDTVKDFVTANLHMTELEHSQTLPLPLSVEEPVNKSLGKLTPADKNRVDMSNRESGNDQLSWLQKCKSKLFSSPPPRKVGQQAGQFPSISPLLQTSRVHISKEEKVTGSGAENANHILSSAISDDLLCVRDDHVSGEDEGHHSEVSANAGKVTKGTGRQKVGRKPKARLNKTYTMKAVVEDAKVFLGRDVEETNLSTSHLQEAANTVDESHEDSEYTEKADTLTSRKRGRAQTSKVTVSEANCSDSEGRSESASVSGHRKKRQTMNPAAETPVPRRYNLRRHKNAIPSVSADVKKAPKEAGAASNAKDLQEDVTTDGGVSDAQVTAVRKEAQEVSSGNAVRYTRMTSGTGESDDPTEVVNIIERVEGDICRACATNNEDAQNVSVIHEEESGEEDEEEDADQPGEASVGKTLWKFFTT